MHLNGILKQSGKYSPLSNKTQYKSPCLKTYLRVSLQMNK